MPAQSGGTSPEAAAADGGVGRNRFVFGFHKCPGGHADHWSAGGAPCGRGGGGAAPLADGGGAGGLGGPPARFALSSSTSTSWLQNTESPIRRLAPTKPRWLSGREASSSALCGVTAC